MSMFGLLASHRAYQQGAAAMAQAEYLARERAEADRRGVLVGEYVLRRQYRAGRLWKVGPWRFYWRGSEPDPLSVTSDNQLAEIDARRWNSLRSMYGL